MGKKKKLSNKAEKKIIIGLFCLTIALVIMIIIAIIYFSQNGTYNENNNILYYSEKKDEEDNNMIIVELDNENETNEVNQNNVIDENSTNTTNNENNSKEIPYYIKVNNKANTVTIYKKDNKGKYTVPVKAMICSIGDATPESGVYSMSDKYSWRLLEGNVYGQYACRITGHILFHSVPYTKKDKSTLEWWEYDKLGTKASLGCVRLKVEDAKWIFDNCPSGTKVEFYSDSTPRTSWKTYSPKDF